MSIWPNYISHNISSFLTREQQTVYQNLSSRFQTYLDEALLNSESSQDLDKTYDIFDILKSFKNKTLQDVAESFLTTLLKDNNSDVYLKKTLKICRKVGGDCFFQYASTKKNQYYSAASLLKIIDGFHQSLSSLSNQAFSIIADCPPYDEGGESFLLSLTSTTTAAVSVAKTQRKSVQTASLQSSTVEIFSRANLAFKEMKALALRFLVSLPEKNRLPMNVYLKLFVKLQKDFKDGLTLAEQAVLVKLVLRATTNADKPISAAYSNADLQQLLEEAALIHKRFGDEFLISFCTAPEFVKKVPLEEFTQALSLIGLLSHNSEILGFLHENTVLFSKEKINLLQLLERLENKAAELGIDAQTKEGDLRDLIRRFEELEFNTQFRKRLDLLEKQYMTVKEYCEEWKKLPINQLVNKALEIREKTLKTSLTQEDILKLIAIGRLALRIKFQIYLHNTQILTILGQLAHEKGCLAQVKTGEGKSMIVALLAFVLTMQRKGVHIISSSHNLAIRDQKKYAQFFKVFGINSSHICENQPHAKQFQGQILYGTATDFEFAIMRELLFSEKLFPVANDAAKNYRFDCVIIDEVDNLTIDTAQNGARMGYPTEAEYDWVYVPILEFVKKNFAANDKEKMSDQETFDRLRTFLLQYLNGIFSVQLEKLSDNNKFKDWLEYAHRALFSLQEGIHYVIGKKQMSDGNFTKGILIVDAENTGRIMHGSRWSGGLHEFVEAKHNLEIERESITPLSFSHAVFYPMYDLIYGLTGTLGSEIEREEIKDIYGIASFDVPTHNPPRRQDLATVILPTEDLYLKTIINRIKMLKQQGRPVLVLCQTINDSKLLQQLAKDQDIPLEVLNEMQEKSEEEVIEHAGMPGSVLIATNTATRGVDILLKGASHANGGLGVIITFYPDSVRVEFQAKGRAGRQGQAGSSEMILSATRLGFANTDPDMRPETSIQMLNKLAKERKAHAGMMKSVHTSRARVERFYYTSYVSAFFKKLTDFTQQLDNESFLTRLATSLSTRKLLQIREPAEGLHIKDHQIAEDALRLLATQGMDKLTWKTLVKLAGNRIKDQAIKDWTLSFYQQVEAMIKKSNLQACAQAKEYLERRLEQALPGIGQTTLGRVLFQNLEDDINNLTDIEMRCLKESITGLYLEKRACWEKYLDPSGNGIIEYLRTITGAKLTNIEEK